MPLPVLVALVVGGIAAIALVLHFAGRSRPFEIDSEATARREWLRHYPADRIRAVLLAASHRAALIETEAGRGLLWSFGADTAAQPLTTISLAERPDGLTLATASFTAPRIRLRLTPDERPLWRARLAGDRLTGAPQ